MMMNKSLKKKLVTRECVPERDMLSNLVPQLLNNKLLIVLIESAKCKGGLGNVHKLTAIGLEITSDSKRGGT